MKKKSIVVISCILLVLILVPLLIACEQDDVQMDLMKKGFYTRYKKGNIENNRFDFVDRDTIDWSIQASVGLYELINAYKPGDILDEKPFDLVYVIKFKDQDGINKAKPAIEQFLLEEGLYEGPRVKVNAIVVADDLFLYVGDEQSIELAMK